MEKKVLKNARDEIIFIYYPQTILKKKCCSLIQFTISARNHRVISENSYSLATERNGRKYDLSLNYYHFVRYEHNDMHWGY